MDSTYNLANLYKHQRALDERIIEEHHVTYESSRPSRILALIVEIGELANETRVFKYWSNKGPSKKEIILDEYADALHFFLSLGIDLNTSFMSYSPIDEHISIVDLFHKVYRYITDLKENYDDAHYQKAFSAFFDLGKMLSLTNEEIIGAYLTKLKVNYERQDNNY